MHRHTFMPAQAGIQSYAITLDARLRGYGEFYWHRLRR